MRVIESFLRCIATERLTCKRAFMDEAQFSDMGVPYRFPCSRSRPYRRDEWENKTLAVSLLSFSSWPPLEDIFLCHTVQRPAELFCKPAVK